MPAITGLIAIALLGFGLGHSSSGPGTAQIKTPAPAVPQARWAALNAALQLRQHDPLSDQEIDQLRETAQEPDKRLVFLVKYAQARMAAIDQLRGDPKLQEDRGQRLHDLLQDFGSIMDEVDDNLEDYDRRNFDMRKGLKALIEADSAFQLKLRAIKNAGENGSAAGDEARDYSFVLEDATDTVNSQLDTARQLLQDQEQRAKALEEARKKREAETRKHTR